MNITCLTYNIHRIQQLTFNMDGQYNYNTGNDYNDQQGYNGYYDDSVFGQPISAENYYPRYGDYDTFQGRYGYYDYRDTPAFDSTVDHAGSYVGEDYLYDSGAKDQDILSDFSNYEELTYPIDPINTSDSQYCSDVPAVTGEHDSLYDIESPEQYFDPDEYGSETESDEDLDYLSKPIGLNSIIRKIEPEYTPFNYVSRYVDPREAARTTYHTYNGAISPVKKTAPMASKKKNIIPFHCDKQLFADGEMIDYTRMASQ